VGGAARLVAYGDGAEASGVFDGQEGDGEWVAVVNGRFAVETDERLLEAAIRKAEADIVAVTVNGGGRPYREKLVTNDKGQVLGFRRFYRYWASPAGVPATYPHILAVNVRQVERLDGGARLDGPFEEAVRRWRSKGLLVKSIAVNGASRDLATDDGMWEFWNARADGAAAGGRSRRGKRGAVAAGARIEGEVEIEDAARVGEGAVVIGPSFLGEGCEVCAGALVRSSVIGPGAKVERGAVVRDRVMLEGDGQASSERPAGPRPRLPRAAEGKGEEFRRWPFVSYARLGKRVVDITGAIVALAFLALIFPIVAIAIKVNSSGPIFYWHRRQGRHGREFSCLKFRTMMPDADVTSEELRAINEVDGPQFKVEHDPRTTLVGEFLRETNIDEIPQFLNVLAGQMSIVGPRPSPDEENQMCPAWREARLSVRPGITGLWQVSRSEDRSNDFQEWIHYDVEYVRELSFGRDMAIMGKTVWVILGGFAKLFVGKREE
jgi:lipopolysaccharide/colanic/teichoic acid biosynthesis glycosyltransferase